MIREATVDDMNVLLSMAGKFFDACQFPSEMVFDPDVLADAMAGLFENDDATVLIDDDLRGAIGGIVYPYYFTGQLAGNEMFWWVEPEHRGALGRQLLRKLEEWATDKGALSFTMIALENSEPEKMARLYHVLGYQPMEHHYMRML